MRAIFLLTQNIRSLLDERRESQHSLAQWCRHSDVWLSHFLAGKREIQLKDLDRVAEFFGIATYQLFQPGISRLTERRSAVERRSGRDRRIGNALRMMRENTESIERARPSRGVRPKAPKTPEG